MQLRKVSANDRDVQRKYRVHVNPEVSYWHEEFDCGGAVGELIYGKQKRRRPVFGVSKRDGLASNFTHVNSHRGEVGSG